MKENFKEEYAAIDVSSSCKLIYFEFSSLKFNLISSFRRDDVVANIMSWLLSYVWEVCPLYTGLCVVTVIVVSVSCDELCHYSCDVMKSMILFCT